MTCCGQTHNKGYAKCTSIGFKVKVIGGIAILDEIMCEAHWKLFKRKFVIQNV